MTTHELKTWPAPFAAILDGSKNYEIRRFDRPFLVGDVLHLREWRPCDAYPECDHPTCRDGEYTGRDLRVTVTYLTPGGEWGLPDDLCVMSIARPGSATTIPADLLARLRAVLDAPIAWAVDDDESASDVPVFFDEQDAKDKRGEWVGDHIDGGMTEAEAEAAVRVVPLVRYTTDLAALLALVEAPAGVEPTCACGSRLVGGVPGDAARFGWVCYECRLAKVEFADGTPLTVGAAMPIGDALRSLAVLEWSDDNDWHQYDPVERGYRFRHRRALTWSPWRKSAAPKNVTVRLVPLTDADRDPNERGPL